MTYEICSCLLQISEGMAQAPEAKP